MEFPELGRHCALTDCKRLDFLPVKCNGCDLIFCLDHYQYEHHACPKPDIIDRQVPACPLCSKPVPLTKECPLDQLVNEHIERNCDSEMAAAKRRKKKQGVCCAKKCKKKELIPLKCSSCNRNVCLTHRHTADHDCAHQKNNGLNDNDAMQKAIQMSLKGKTAPKTSLEEARSKQQEAMDRVIAERLQRQETQIRERAQREAERHQSSSKGNNCSLQ